VGDSLPAGDGYVGGTGGRLGCRASLDRDDVDPAVEVVEHRLDLDTGQAPLAVGIVRRQTVDRCLEHLPADVVAAPPEAPEDVFLEDERPPGSHQQPALGAGQPAQERRELDAGWIEAPRGR